MSEELKPCPFCGGPAVVSEYNGGFASISCGGRCSFTPHAFGFPSVDSAIAAWNTRAERTCTYDSAEDYSLVCSACGWNRRGALIIPNYCPHCGARVENANEDELAATHHRFKAVGE